VCRCLGLLAKFRYGCLRSHAPSGLDTKLHLSTQLSVIGVTRRCEGGKGQAVRLSSARVVKKRGVSLLALAFSGRGRSWRRLTVMEGEKGPRLGGVRTGRGPGVDWVCESQSQALEGRKLAS
jgi:hypothetical protein